MQCWLKVICIIHASCSVGIAVFMLLFLAIALCSNNSCCCCQSWLLVLYVTPYSGAKHIWFIWFMWIVFSMSGCHRPCWELYHSRCLPIHFDYSAFAVSSDSLRSLIWSSQAQLSSRLQPRAGSQGKCRDPNIAAITNYIQLQLAKVVDAM